MSIVDKVLDIIENDLNMEDENKYLEEYFRLRKIKFEIKEILI